MLPTHYYSTERSSLGDTAIMEKQLRETRKLEYTILLDNILSFAFVVALIIGCALLV